ncbi:uncharacterized protein BDR25DRAFT_340590 [Lindgomyces ingoldianus]|uniref:Uncharacterized protein n=1 Tax=Lindgomyces ingoldianus TaxID=673940 RepID=A0ACB6R9D5_9PLEO|nr:uncharacterized protein BDR25DRAFT_340590 [Lindgomyces ingoldianus]KAF2474937.1 hypothetical protein BDR25DRAFT_340590 [Lindgomyces ingoldianus]
MINMFFNSRSLFATAFVCFVAWETRALDLQPLSSPPSIIPGHSSKRGASPLELVPLEDPSVLTTGHGAKREVPGNGCFDPKNDSTFFWGAYAGDNIYMANFTLSNPGDNEFILPVESFAKRLKAIHCGSSSAPMVIEFNDKDSFNYAKGQWEWVNNKDNNTFTLVTSPNQCYPGDDRSPYLVTNIQFDDAKLEASLTAQEKEWKDIAHTFHLKLGHEFVDPEYANQTHPHLMHMKRGTKTMDISHSFNHNLFHLSKGDTTGLDLSADAEISTGGQIIADLDVKTTLWVPTDVNINIHPQGVHADFTLTMNADGTLGKAIDWTMKPEIEIPVEALKIGKLLEIGPFVTMGIHFGSTQLTGTAKITTGARATLDDAAKVTVDLRHPDQNAISGWTPKFEKIPPSFSAEISGGVRAWAELGIQLKAEVLGKWGYQASVDAELPYFEATFGAEVNTAGVCGTQKTKGVNLGANVGINVNLNAGKVNQAPDYRKDLFETSWPLFTTCMGIGPDNVKTSTLKPTPTSTKDPVTSDSQPTVTDVPTNSDPASTGSDSGIPTATESPVITSALPLSTGSPGTISAGTGFTTIGGNSTLLKMVRRQPTALYL